MQEIFGNNGVPNTFSLIFQHQKFAYKKTAVLVVAMVGKRSTKHRMYNVYRPNTGIQSAAEPLSDIKTKYHKVISGYFIKGGVLRQIVLHIQ